MYIEHRESFRHRWLWWFKASDKIHTNSVVIAATNIHTLAYFGILSLACCLILLLEIRLASYNTASIF